MRHVTLTVIFISVWDKVGNVKIYFGAMYNEIGTVQKRLNLKTVHYI